MIEITAGNLDPLFTTSVATPTTTPGLTFSPEPVAANLILASPPVPGSGAGVGVFRQLASQDSAFYTSPPTVLSSGVLIYTFNHGLGVIPGHVRPVFRCVIAEFLGGQSGAAVGDEIPLAAIWDTVEGSNPFGIFKNATSVVIAFTTDYAGAQTHNLLVAAKGGGTGNPTLNSDFRLVVYARL